MPETMQLNQKHLKAIKAEINSVSLAEDIKQFFHQRRADIPQSEEYIKARDDYDKYFEILEEKLPGEFNLIYEIDSSLWAIVAAAEDSAYQQGFKDGVNFLTFVTAGNDSLTMTEIKQLPIKNTISIADHPMFKELWKKKVDAHNKLADQIRNAGIDLQLFINYKKAVEDLKKIGIEYEMVGRI